MKKLLILTPQLPFPPHQGTTIRNYNLIRYLAEHYQIYLFTFLAEGQQLGPDNPLRQLCQRVETAQQPQRAILQRGVQTVSQPQPDMALRLASPQAQEILTRLVTEEAVDLLQVEGIEMAAYGRLAQAVSQAQGRPLPLLFDDHNAEYLLQKRAALVDLGQPRRWLAGAYSLVQWWKLARYERQICEEAQGVAVVSQPDQQALARLSPRIQPRVIPNGIDLAAYPPGHPQAVEPGTLLFTGKMDYRPNVDAALWFGQQVLPHIRVRVPHARFLVVGMNPHPRLDVLRADPGITITGAVDAILPYLQQAAVYVVPMRVGGGTRFKVLEAMSCAKAIVSTSLGVEGIGVTHGQELLIGDSPEAFAAHCSRLLLEEEPGQGQSLGRAARSFVESHYAWPRIIPHMLDLLESIALSRV
jgi:glycosyltransferase involved in cell wall biosynthesis